VPGCGFRGADDGPHRCVSCLSLTFALALGPRLYCLLTVVRSFVAALTRASALTLSTGNIQKVSAMATDDFFVYGHLDLHRQLQLQLTQGPSVGLWCGSGDIKGR